MRVDLVVFDIAGTTVYDGDAVHDCLAAALVNAGVPTTRDQVNALMGIPKPQAIASLVGSFRKTSPTDEEVDAIYGDFESLMLDHYQHGTSIREADGASAVFRALRARGIKVALDTGFSRSIVDAILARLGWDESLIDATVASDEVLHGRPEPDMVWRAMELTGVTDASRVAKVGDTPADLRQGDESGCILVVGVTTGSHTEEELARYPHTHLIDSLAELLPIIEDVDAGYERAPGDLSVPLLFTPGPLTTSNGVKTAMLHDLGSRDGEFIEIVARLHQRLLALAGTSREDGYAAVLLQGSGTYAVEAMLGSLVPPDGRLLVLENGAYGRRMLEIARVLGIWCVALEYPPAKPIEPGDVARALEGDRGITHVALVHCETTSGVLNPLPAIAGVVQAAGRRLLVDAMSSFGGIPLDVHDGIDALVASSNKCLEGVPGVAFAISQVALLQSSAARRSVSLDLAAQWRGFEHDGQFRFTPPTHVILALEQALYELDREGGVAGRAARYHANHVRLVDGMRRLGFREVVAPEHQSDIITSFFYPEDPAFTFDDFYARLRERNFVIYPGKLMDAGCFRIGSIGRLYPDDIDALLVAVSEVVTRPIPSAVD